MSKLIGDTSQGLLQRVLDHPKMTRGGVVIVTVDARGETNLVTNLPASEALDALSAAGWTMAARSETNPMDVDVVLGASPFEPQH